MGTIRGGPFSCAGGPSAGVDIVPLNTMVTLAENRAKTAFLPIFRLFFACGNAVIHV